MLTLTTKEKLEAAKKLTENLKSQLKEEQRAMFAAERAVQAKKDAEFRLRLFKDFGVEDNPKAGQCYALAWQYGHSAGYSEVEGYFTDLVELIK